MELKNILTEKEYKGLNLMDGNIHPMYVKMKKGGKVMYGSFMDGYMELENQGYKPVFEDEEEHICSITGRKYTGYGNNAYPFEGRCCDWANERYVISARMSGFSPELIKSYGGNKMFANLMDRALSNRK